MKNLLHCSLLLISILLFFSVNSEAKAPVRVLVVTGGHNYDKPSFNEMLGSLGQGITSEIVEFPAAYDQFLPENRGNYDVLVFYHMWQKSTPEQEKIFADCIREGKALVVLHHSICAFDEWTEYRNIIGGKYFHKPTVVDGKEYDKCSYLHGLRFTVQVANKKHPVTKGVKDFEIFDETYKGYYIAQGAEPLLTTTEKSSNPVIGWTWKYGKARVVTLQSGHDTPTFQNENYRKLLKQSIEWSYAGSK
ncbi:MAG TPA: ThuA domain-containing protein [Prolixibacteraceae bacterium]|nr:ThuA domain-containing protein [Prolixibacteraceae bacterium]